MTSKLTVKKQPVKSKQTAPETKKPKNLNEAVKIAIQFGGTHNELKAVRKELVAKRNAIDAQIKQLDSATDVIEKVLSGAQKILASICGQ